MFNEFRQQLMSARNYIDYVVDFNFDEKDKNKVTDFGAFDVYSNKRFSTVENFVKEIKKTKGFLFLTKGNSKVKKLSEILKEAFKNEGDGCHIESVLVGKQIELLDQPYYRYVASVSPEMYILNEIKNIHFKRREWFESGNAFLHTEPKIIKSIFKMDSKNSFVILDFIGAKKFEKGMTCEEKLEILSNWFYNENEPFFFNNCFLEEYYQPTVSDYCFTFRNKKDDELYNQISEEKMFYL